MGTGRLSIVSHGGFRSAAAYRPPVRAYSDPLKAVPSTGPPAVDYLRSRVPAMSRRADTR
jgi:hypothetical protein